MPRYISIVLGAFCAVFISPLNAFAGYTPAQNFGAIVGTRTEQFTIEYTATTTQEVAQLSVVTCSTVGTGDGVFFVALTGSNAVPSDRHRVATSTTATTATTCPTTATTTVVFAPSLQVVPGVHLTFIAYQTSPTNVQHVVGTLNTNYPCFHYGVHTSGWDSCATDSWGSFFSTYSSSTAPNPQFCAPGNPYCTPVAPLTPECAFTDLGGCISQGIAFVFYPSEESKLALSRTPKFASTSPYGYVANFGELITLMENATNTPLKLTFNFGSFNGLSNAFGNASSTAFDSSDHTFFDSCSINTYTKGMYDTWVKTGFRYALWLLLLGFYFILLRKLI